MIERVLARVRSAIAQQQQPAIVELGGSLAKNTYLNGDHDVDVFVRFSQEIPDAELSDRLERILRHGFKTVERVHGSRDYFHVIEGAFVFEFIPVVNIGSWREACNVTDMSPLHVEYVTRHVLERPWLVDDIRLTKQFCKAAKVYGAESYIGGFSGHVIDLLNVHYGGFRKLLAAAAAWPAKVVLDPERHYEDPLLALNTSKILAPLVIVDPVQPDRNSAAAVTEYAFKKFKEEARAYIAAAPSEQERFFAVRLLRIPAMRKEHPSARILTVELTPLQGKKDIVGAKCYKAYEHLLTQILEHRFTLLASRWEFTPQRATIFFACKPGMLPPTIEVVGPPVHRTEDVARFQHAHKTTFTRDGRLYAIDRRKYRDPLPLLRKLVRQKYITERVRAARVR